MSTPIWHFWNPNSGPFGGLIAGTLLACTMLFTAIVVIDHVVPKQACDSAELMVMEDI
jgi:hypothetical protein